MYIMIYESSRSSQYIYYDIRCLMNHVRDILICTCNVLSENIDNHTIITVYSSSRF